MNVVLSPGDGRPGEMGPSIDLELGSVQHPDPAVLTVEQLLAEAQRLGRRPVKRSKPATMINWIWAGWHTEQAGILGEFCNTVFIHVRIAAVLHWSPASWHVMLCCVDFVQWYLLLQMQGKTISFDSMCHACNKLCAGDVELVCDTLTEPSGQQQDDMLQQQQQQATMLAEQQQQQAALFAQQRAQSGWAQPQLQPGVQQLQVPNDAAMQQQLLFAQQQQQQEQATLLLFAQQQEQGAMPAQQQQQEQGAMLAQQQQQAAMLAAQQQQQHAAKLAAQQQQQQQQAAKLAAQQQQQQQQAAMMAAQQQQQQAAKLAAQQQQQQQQQAAMLAAQLAQQQQQHAWPVLTQPQQQSRVQQLQVPYDAAMQQQLLLQLLLQQQQAQAAMPAQQQQQQAAKPAQQQQLQAAMLAAQQAAMLAAQQQQQQQQTAMRAAWPVQQQLQQQARPVLPQPQHQPGVQQQVAQQKGPAALPLQQHPCVTQLQEQQQQQQQYKPQQAVLSPPQQQQQQQQGGEAQRQQQAGQEAEMRGTQHGMPAVGSATGASISSTAIAPQNLGVPSAGFGGLGAGGAADMPAAQGSTWLGAEVSTAQEPSGPWDGSPGKESPGTSYVSALAVLFVTCIWLIDLLVFNTKWRRVVQDRSTHRIMTTVRRLRMMMTCQLDQSRQRSRNANKSRVSAVCI
jgi:hypothetical protein